MKNSLLLVFLLSCLNLFSQDLIIRDLASNEAIANASVQHLSSTIIDYSDANGAVFLNNYIKGEDLLISCVGYFELAIIGEQFEPGQKKVVYLVQQIVSMKEALVITEFGGEEKLTDTPKQAELIPAASIKFLNPQTSADALQTTGMVLVQKSQAGGGSPIMRGFEANKILLVVDGVRMNNAIYRSGHLQNAITIDPLILERVELVFGPASVVYGSDALGGVVHYRTKNPAFAKGNEQEVKANLFGRIASAAQERTVHLDFSVAEGNWASLTSITRSSFEDLRMGSWRTHGDEHWGLGDEFVLRSEGADQVLENPDPEVQRGTAYAQLDFLQKFRIKLGEHWIINSNFQLSTSSNIPRFDNLNDYRNGEPRWAEWNYGPQKRTLFSINAQQKQKTRYYDALSMTAAYQALEESRFKRQLYSEVRNAQVEKVKVFSFNLDFIKHLENQAQLNYGLDLVFNDVRSSASDRNLVTREINDAITRYPNGGSSMNTFGAYLTYKKDIRENFRLDLGARYSHAVLASNYDENGLFDLPFDNIEFNNGAFTGSAGLVYKASDTWRINAVLATAYRIPNVDDFAKVRENGGFVIIPNDELKPEYVYSGELSTSKDLLNEKVQLKAGGFYSFITDAIVPRPYQINGEDSLFIDGENARIETNVNADEAFIYGAFFTFNAQFNQHLSASGSVNYTFGEDQSSGLPLSHIPPLFGRVGLSYKVEKFQGELYAFYNGEKPIERYGAGGTDKAEEALDSGTPAWWTLNLATSYYISQQLEAQVGLENILDMHYKPFASGPSAPGRNLYLAIRARF
ncbi:MAG: TonB-dependent receptor [Flavobacteriales bacterium]|nr:TonB-dependent receptor [Flavobacteriales bacterium]